MMTLDQLDTRLVVLITDYLDGVTEAKPAERPQHFANLIAALLAAAVDVAASTLDRRYAEAWLRFNAKAMRKHLLNQLDRAADMRRDTH